MTAQTLCPRSRTTTPTPCLRSQRLCQHHVCVVNDYADSQISRISLRNRNISQNNFRCCTKKGIDTDPSSSKCWADQIVTLFYLDLSWILILILISVDCLINIIGYLFVDCLINLRSSCYFFPSSLPDVVVVCLGWERGGEAFINI